MHTNHNPTTNEPHKPAIGGAQSVGAVSGKTYGPSHLVVGVYTITCLVNGRQYVGSSVDIMSRWRVHRARLNAEQHPAKQLQADWNQYHADKFRFAVAYQVPASTPDEDLIEFEQKFIDELKPVYNVVPLAGETTGFTHSDEARHKMRLAKRKS